MIYILIRQQPRIFIRLIRAIFDDGIVHEVSGGQASWRIRSQDDAFGPVDRLYEGQMKRYNALNYYWSAPLAIPRLDFIVMRSLGKCLKVRSYEKYAGLRSRIAPFAFKLGEMSADWQSLELLFRQIFRANTTLFTLSGVTRVARRLHCSAL